MAKFLREVSEVEGEMVGHMGSGLETASNSWDLGLYGFTGKSQAERET